MVNRKIAPAIKDAIDYTLELKPCQKFLLDNNVPVYAIDAGAEDVIQVELVFHAGSWYETGNLLAATTNHLLKNGTAAHSAFAINEHFLRFTSSRCFIFCRYISSSSCGKSPPTTEIC